MSNVEVGERRFDCLPGAKLEYRLGMRSMMVAEGDRKMPKWRNLYPTTFLYGVSPGRFIWLLENPPSRGLNQLIILWHTIVYEPPG